MNRISQSRRYSPSPLAERAWTDLVSNSTVIPAIDLKKHFEQYYETESFPIECLDSLLHEAVHHWCFHSIVGSALATLHFRAHTAIMDKRLFLESRDHRRQLSEYIFRFEVAQMLLRPIAEGLALFAEYDVEPMPQTRAVSRPMSLIYKHFTADGSRHFSENWGPSAVPVLRNVRRSKQHILKKANLFLEPLSCSAGGYLPGYLTVKNLWRVASDECEAFLDKDLFLLLLQRYFYRDYGLIAHLLRPLENDDGHVEDMLNYFGKRLWDFRSLDFAKEAKRIDSTDDFVESSTEEAIAGQINTDEDLITEGKYLLGSAIESLRFDSVEPGLDDLKLLYGQILSQRPYMRLGTLKVKVDRRLPGRLRITAGTKTLMEMAGDYKLAKKRETGVLTILISVSGLYKITSITVAGKVIAVEYPPSIEQLMAEDLHSFARNSYMYTEKIGDLGSIIRRDFHHLALDAIDELADSIRDSRDELLGPETVNSIKECLSEFEPHVDEIYKFATLLWADETDWDKGAMATKGLQPLLVRGDLVRNLAALSVASSTSLSVSQVKSALENGDAVISSLKELEAIADATGIPLVYEMPDGTIDSFV
jgi:hypothetical protein